MSNLMSNYSPLEVTFVKGEGCWLTDTKGDQYLDALSGIGVVNLGHCHPVITKNLIDQSQQLLHTSNVYRIGNQEKLAKELCTLAKMDKVFFSNSGAEANEAAIKIVRLFARSKDIEKPVILTANQGFHGRTMATLSATGQSKVQAGFAPLMSEFIHVNYDDIEAISDYQSNANVVAVMVEPIQGEAGIIIPKNDYLNKVQEVCNKNGWLLILDGVQSCMGRTGKLFAHEHNQITPDILCLAKGLGNGVPIGACLAKGVASKMLTPGTHGSTFGGNPLVTSAALGVLDVFQNTNVLENVNKMSEYFRSEFDNKIKNNIAVKELRIKGLMIGIGLDSNIIDCSQLVKKALKDNLLINVTGTTIRMLPPLIITKEEIDILISKLIKLIST
ncbi:acetylornithine aminotransferase [Candidatus Pseudothioglobus singularis]|uniref:aspartate aminotransferase family protein n=1 Tax=Candidatus Pseudothioglobus singularis TaxID=1427364 RepID=UPI0008060CAD|nr:aspartate aminotransferase family protein [Candidatus Pseudothioglobus singularis]ANQ66412.1 acetylornithine aminotransferase [Candidatus Pseudothioglobus singularis]MDC0470129.1 aspartate aminotransferase family protein [Candidatus Pseudothioglobus singularis]MDP0595173.1 aspartate aminotransferase family protein [Candidatus Thioglobus sp.]